MIFCYQNVFFVSQEIFNRKNIDLQLLISYQRINPNRKVENEKRGYFQKLFLEKRNTPGYFYYILKYNRAISTDDEEITRTLRSSR